MPPVLNANALNIDTRQVNTFTLPPAVNLGNETLTYDLKYANGSALSFPWLSFNPVTLVLSTTDQVPNSPTLNLELSCMDGVNPIVTSPLVLNFVNKPFYNST